MLILDTHILLQSMEGRLREGEVRVMDDFWSISGVTLWEIAWLSREGRVRVGLDDHRLQSILAEMTIWPIDLEVAQALRRLDFRSDPADEIIAATSLAHDIPLLTRDSRILASKVVPLAAV